MCSWWGGHLASVANKAEEKELQALLKADGKHRYWIGANDLKKEGSFEWSDGSKMAYKNWKRGEPNNRFRRRGGEDCVFAFARRGMVWNDAPCRRMRLRFVCKK